jgi:formate dehydrogenase subunit beta
MRPCEIRAFVELVKLNQGVRENVVIIGADCPGAVTNSGFASAAGDEGLDRRFLEAAVSGDWEGLELSPACRVCEEPTPDGADVLIGLFGGERGEFWATAPTEAGRDLLQGLDLARAARPSGRDEAVSALKESRRTARDRMFSETAEKVSDLPHLTEYLARCTNCLNCRVACPVCYCRECVFTTDVFDHDPARYVAWAERKGAVKMPSDTVFYHLTRLAHIATACVGCGQCSNACPNDIPVMELFRTVSHKAQNDFGYRAGSDPEAPPPLSVFKEDEFGEVVGL